MLTRHDLGIQAGNYYRNSNLPENFAVNDDDEKSESDSDEKKNKWKKKYKSRYPKTIRKVFRLNDKLEENYNYYEKVH